MFDADWIEVHPHGGPISAGINVAVLARILGVSYLNACRIVYVIDETGPIETYGFAYGTLRDHAEKGEERFTVIWDHADDSVRYDLIYVASHVTLLLPSTRSNGLLLVG